MAMKTKYLENVPTVDETEAHAAAEGLRLDIDSTWGFRLLQREVEDLSETGVMIRFAIDSLPTHVRSLQEDLVWIEEWPSEMEALLESECLASLF